MNPMNRTIGLLLMTLLLFGAAGPRASAENDSPPDHRLELGDALLIQIENVGGGLPAYREIVDSDGQIEVPYLGMLHAAGKSLATLQSDIATAYADSRLATDAAVHIRLVTHFEPPPNRETLIRSTPPRRPVRLDAIPPIPTPEN